MLCRFSSSALLLFCTSVILQFCSVDVKKAAMRGFFDSIPLLSLGSPFRKKIQQRKDGEENADP